jgi:hypothetical protein
MAVSLIWGEEEADVHKTKPVDLDRTRARIVALERLLGEFRAQMEVAAQAYREAAAGYMSEWYVDETGRGVFGHGKVSRALGSEGVGEVVAGMWRLVGGISDLVERHLGAGSPVWPHSSEHLSYPEKPDRDLPSYTSTLPVRDALREVASPLGEFLASKGLADQGVDGRWTDGPEVRFRGDVGSSPEMEAAFQRYCGIFYQAQKVQRAIDEATNDLGFDEIWRWWDAAMSGTTDEA